MIWTVTYEVPWLCDPQSTEWVCPESMDMTTALRRFQEQFPSAEVINISPKTQP